MALKIEIIPKTDTSPLYLVIADRNGVKAWPVHRANFSGEIGDMKQIQARVPFSMKRGIVKFIDIYGNGHMIRYDEANDQPPEMSDDEKWAARLAAIDAERKKNGLPPETNPLKRMHPRDFAKIPAEDLPDWAKPVEEEGL